MIFIVSKSLLSSARQDWETPRDLYKFLDERYKFELDPCSNDHNHKTDCYFTKEEDGLKREWSIVDSAFMNPPYNREVKDWIKKAYTEAKIGMIVVCLIAARTDTAWWHDYCMKANEIWFIRGRLHFTNKSIDDYTGNTKTSPSTFPSAIIVFDGLRRSLPAKPVFKTLTINKKTGSMLLSK